MARREAAGVPRTVRVLAIGGVDPSGGAGLGADARMLQACGGLALPVPACLTVQSRHGFAVLEPVSRPLLEAMVRAALADGPVDAVKIGLLGDAALAYVVAELVVPWRDAGVPLVVDPVLSATAGGWDGPAALGEPYRTALVPHATLLTPNLSELAMLAPDGPGALLAAGCRGVLVKGGHAEDDVLEDVLHTAAGELVLRHPRLDRGPVHGTGCALASAAAFHLGAGAALEDAARAAVERLQRCLQATPPSRDGRPTPLVIV